MSVYEQVGVICEAHGFAYQDFCDCPDDQVRPIRLEVGCRVMVRTASNELERAAIARIPRWWQDRTRNAVVTTSGAFPKAWVKFDGARVAVPWPLADVFTDMEAAQARVADCATEDAS